MSLNQVLTIESDLIKAVVTGIFSLKEAKRTFSKLLDMAALKDSKKILIDGTAIIGDPLTIERFYYSTFAAHESTTRLRHRVLFAYVLIPPVLDPDRFGETVAVNRGMAVKVFDNEPDALKWLGVAPANKVE